MSKEIKTIAIPAYLWEKYRLRVSRQTVYNWMSKGLRGETLPYTVIDNRQTARFPGTRRTTEEQLDAFLQRCGIKLPYLDRGNDWAGPSEDVDSEQDGGSLES
jgi:hypothetical protein